jgi:8-oxo-dGTP diphosphatase
MRAVKEKKSEEIAMRTARLAFSPLASRFASALFDLLNDWEVVRMLAEVPWPLDYSDVETFLRRDPGGTDAFVLLGDSGPMGVVSFKRSGSGNPPRKMPRLGYWIGRAHWGRGHGTEAVGALVDHAFDNDPGERIGAGVFYDNLASRRLLEKLGFSEAGRYLTRSASRACEVETADMQITRAEWARAKAARA